MVSTKLHQYKIFFHLHTQPWYSHQPSSPYLCNTSDYVSSTRGKRNDSTDDLGALGTTGLGMHALECYSNGPTRSCPGRKSASPEEIFATKVLKFLQIVEPPLKICVCVTIYWDMIGLGITKGNLWLKLCKGKLQGMYIDDHIWKTSRNVGKCKEWRTEHLMTADASQK